MTNKPSFETPLRPSLALSFMNKVVSKSFVLYKVAEAIGYGHCCLYLDIINNNLTVLLFFVLFKTITSPKSMLLYELEQTNFLEVDAKFK